MPSKEWQQLTTTAGRAVTCRIIAARRRAAAGRRARRTATTGCHTTSGRCGGCGGCDRPAAAHSTVIVQPPHRVVVCTQFHSHKPRHRTDSDSKAVCSVGICLVLCFDTVDGCCVEISWCGYIEAVVTLWHDPTHRPLNTSHQRRRDTAGMCEHTRVNGHVGSVDCNRLTPTPPPKQ